MIRLIKVYMIVRNEKTKSLTIQKILCMYSGGQELKVKVRSGSAISVRYMDS